MTVYTTFDNEFNTWNVMNDESGKCEFYGDIEGLEEWVDEHPEAKEL